MYIRFYFPHPFHPDAGKLSSKVVSDFPCLPDFSHEIHLSVLGFGAGHDVYYKPVKIKWSGGNAKTPPFYPVIHLDFTKETKKTLELKEKG